MNFINAMSVLFLGLLIVGSVYFIKSNKIEKKDVSYPFYLSTRDNITNVRSGPSLDYPVILVYNKKNVPIKVIDSNGQWYQIEDINGKRGWIYSNLTSKNRTVVTIDEASVYIISQISSKKIAVIKANNILKVIKCSKGVNSFCKIEFSIQKNYKITGWVLKSAIWGNVSD